MHPQRQPCDPLDSPRAGRDHAGLVAGAAPWKAAQRSDREQRLGFMPIETNLQIRLYFYWT